MRARRRAVIAGLALSGWGCAFELAPPVVDPDEIEIVVASDRDDAMWRRQPGEQPLQLLRSDNGQNLLYVGNDDFDEAIGLRFTLPEGAPIATAALDLWRRAGSAGEELSLTVRIWADPIPAFQASRVGPEEHAGTGYMGLGAAWRPGRDDGSIRSPDLSEELRSFIAQHGEGSAVGVFVSASPPARGVPPSYIGVDDTSTPSGRPARLVITRER
jgi:hypothetical protein